MNDILLSGKNPLDRIVSVEAEDGVLEIYRELEDGSVVTEFLKSNFWILSSKNINGKGIRLKGDLYYKWGWQFESREEYDKVRRYWKDKDIYTIYEAKESALVNKGLTYFKGMKHNEPSILSFDIESSGLAHNESSQVYLISNTFRRNGKITRKLFDFKEYNNDGEMIEDWCKWVKEMNPAILCGHNIYSYDIPYLRHCANLRDKEMRLGRNDSKIYIQTTYEAKFRVDGSKDLHYHRARIHGREIVDTMFLAYRYDIATKKYDSYGLKNIIKQEGLENKNRVFYDASKIKDNVNNPEEWEKIKAYAMFDADDALALYDLMSPASFYTTQMVPKSYQEVTSSATGSQINSILVRSYLQEGHSIPKATDSSHFAGAISLGNPGVYNNVLKVDVASLYPSIMIAYEVFDRDKDPKGNFKNLITTLTKQRLEHKQLAKETNDKYYKDLEQAEKITINSCYGFMGAPGLNFNSIRNAAFVTEKGREILQKAIDWSSDYKLVNADTDSISICKVDGAEWTEEEQQEFLTGLNAQFPEKIKWEHDGYYKKVVVIKIKNYILYDGKKVKIKGSALKGTGKEPALREFMEKVVDSLLNDKDNLQELYNKYAKEALEVKDIKRWVSKKTLSDKTFNSTRTNETKIADAVEGTDYQEGDKIYCYFRPDGSLRLVEKFDGEYDKKVLLKKLHATAQIFENVLDTKNLFPNYALKRNQENLELLCQ